MRKKLLLNIAVVTFAMTWALGAENNSKPICPDEENFQELDARAIPSVWKFITDPNNSAFFTLRLAVEASSFFNFNFEYLEFLRFLKKTEEQALIYDSIGLSL
jgi:hypothetical protein